MELTKNERIMKTAGLLYSLTFILAALLFLFVPDILFKGFNMISQAIVPDLPMASDTGKFWLSMTLSMMAGVTITSWLIFRDVKKYYTMAIPLVVMKFTSAFFGLGFFVAGFFCVNTEWNTLANGIIFLTDFPLGMVMLVLYNKVKV